ncbi:MAG: chemotaxis protein CheB [Myxococcales bacterium]|nr:chemotaxis protein CheB [Myxococcales bacterium]
MSRPAQPTVESRGSAPTPPPAPIDLFGGSRGAAAHAPRDLALAGQPTAYDLVAIGVSTGGPPALLALLPTLPRDFAVPILVVQHIAEAFTHELAQLLAAKCQLPVRVAEHGAPLAPGVTLALGGSHLLVRRVRLASEDAPTVVTELSQAPPENQCRPAADVLFRSAAATLGRRVLGVVLTGMGQDGLVGARVLRGMGATVIAQDEASSVVWGMAGAVARAGLAEAVLPLADIGPAILRRAYPTLAHLSVGAR